MSLLPFFDLIFIPKQRPLNAWGLRQLLKWLGLNFLGIPRFGTHIMRDIFISYFWPGMRRVGFLCNSMN